MHHTALFCSNRPEQDNDLNEEVFHWWKAGKVQLETKSKSNDPEVLLANNIFNTTCVRQTDGRHEKGLLWKDNSNLPDNQTISQKSTNEPEQYKKYIEGIQGDLEKGYIAKVHFHQQNDTSWYITHYGLISPIISNKIRRICNAKALQSGTSLKDKLLAGPDLLRNMLGILLRFRKGAIAIQGDIEAMFLHIGIRQQYRRYRRFTWRQPNSPELEVYENQRHIFGARDSPDCANFALQQTAKDDIEDHQNFQENLQRTF